MQGSICIRWPKGSGRHELVRCLRQRVIAVREGGLDGRRMQLHGFSLAFGTKNVNDQREPFLTRALTRRKTLPMLIYKIFREPEYRAFVEAGRTLGAPVDLTDGYIHFSTAEQLPGTLAKYFGGEEGLMLLALDPAQLDPLKWEPARGGALFPHLYRALLPADVIWSRPLPLGPNGHDIGELG